MKWFFETTVEDGEVQVNGPFDSEQEAIDYIAVVEAAKPDRGYGSPFEESDDYMVTGPRIVAKIHMASGYGTMLFSDGTSRPLVPPA
jgi:hypothetical protein